MGCDAGVTDATPAFRWLSSAMLSSSLSPSEMDIEVTEPQDGESLGPAVGLGGEWLGWLRP